MKDDQGRGAGPETSYVGAAGPLAGGLVVAGAVCWGGLLWWLCGGLVKACQGQGAI